MIARLLAKAPVVRVYMDQDSGFRAGFLAAFHWRVKNRMADAFYVRVLKEATTDQKDSATTKSRAEFKKWQDANPGLTPNEIELLMVKAEMRRMAAIGHWGDKWLVHPLPNKSGPEKRICWLTDMSDLRRRSGGPAVPQGNAAPGGSLLHAGAPTPQPG